jgi:hypothetical protein
MRSTATVASLLQLHLSACSMMTVAASLHARPLLIQKKYAHFSAAAAIYTRVLQYMPANSDSFIPHTRYTDTVPAATAELYCCTHAQRSAHCRQLPAAASV